MIDWDSILDTRATHYVCGIEWGASVSISLDSRNVDAETNDKLAALISEIEDVLKNDADEIDENNSNAEFEITCLMDIPHKENMPDDVNGAVNLARQINKTVQNHNEGKGVPQKFYLAPLVPWMGVK